jgi:hypothetical protein
MGTKNETLKLPPQADDGSIFLQPYRRNADTPREAVNGKDKTGFKQ